MDALTTGQQIVIVLVAAILGWFGKMVWAKIEHAHNRTSLLEKDHAEFREHAAETFATKAEFREAINRVDGKLDRVLEMLANRMQK